MLHLASMEKALPLLGIALAAAVGVGCGVTGYATTMPPETLWHGLQIERERLAAQASTADLKKA